MKSVLVIVFLLVMVVIVVAATLIKNQARFFETPGFVERLSIYLGQHSAATADNHSFPELRTPVFHLGADSLFNSVLESISELGWRLRQIDEEELTVSLVIVTPLFRFSDDLVVQVQPKNAPLNAEESTLHIHSTSRKGKADFAANAGHIQTLVQRLRQKVNQGRVVQP